MTRENCSRIAKEALAHFIETERMKSVPKFIFAGANLVMQEFNREVIYNFEEQEAFELVIMYLSRVNNISNLQNISLGEFQRLTADFINRQREVMISLLSMR